MPALVLAGILAALNNGCGNKSTPEGGQKPGVGSKAPTVVSVEKTSFNEVTSQLDPGGNFYLYLGTAQWLDGLSTKVGVWRQTFTAMPDLKPENTANINKAFDIVTSLVKDSGIEDVSGVGHEFGGNREGHVSQQGAAASLSRQRRRLPLAARRPGTAPAHRP